MVRRSAPDLGRSIPQRKAWQGRDAVVRAVGPAALAGVRLEGSTVEPGRDILCKSRLTLTAADNPSDAADNAVNLGRQWDRHRETDSKGAIECWQS
jgi:succinyl-CoA synthetase beta subunit